MHHRVKFYSTPNFLTKPPSLPPKHDFRYPLRERLAEVSPDFMKYADDIDNISARWKIGYVIGCLMTYGIFVLFSQDSRAIVAGGTFASIALLARVKWNLRRFAWYWIFLAVTVLLHLLLIAAFDEAINIHPTIVLAPIGIADFAILLFALAKLEKMMAS